MNEEKGFLDRQQQLDLIKEFEQFKVVLNATAETCQKLEDEVENWVVLRKAVTWLGGASGLAGLAWFLLQHIKL